MPNHPIKKGPEGGRFQKSRGADPRYLLDGKNDKVCTGPRGGHFQRYGRGKKRYLLEY